MEYQPVVEEEGVAGPQPPGEMLVAQDMVGETYPAEIYEESQLQGEFREVRTVMVDAGPNIHHPLVSACAFDGQEELLWMGNQGGHITSYYGMDMQKYTSFQVFNNSEIRSLLTLDGRVFALTNNTLRCSSKFGRKLFVYTDNVMENMQCMLQSGPQSLLLAGHQNRVVEMDIETQQQVRTLEVNDPGIAILRYSNNFICAGDTSGKVTLRDPASFKPQHVLEAHSGTLSDFDVHGNTLITCGFASRMGNLTVDRFLMVYDLRVMRAVAPMQAPIDPMFLRFVPTYSDRLCVVSQTGQFLLLEQGALTPSSLLTYQVRTEGAAVVSFDISSSCHAMAFGDNMGYLHLFTSREQPNAVFNVYSTETEFAPVDNVAPMSFNDELAPMSIIPMQYPTTGKLFSEWQEEFSQKVYRKPLALDADILRSVKMVQNVGYAPNSGSKRRNQVPYKVPHINKGPERKASVPDSPLGRGEDPFVVVPKKYRKVEIKYSKLGVEDFDFRHYNKTNFAGLETHIPNAYCNAMLQVLYFIEPLRCSMLSHTCEKEFCLACELGFLFHMLDMQKGRTCQASNFLRAFRTIPEASALGLVLGDAEETAGKANLPRLIQNWNRFILQQTHSELLDTQREEERRKEAEGQDLAKEVKDSIISKLFATEVINTFRCRCQEENVRNMTTFLFDLVYPDCMPSGSPGPVHYPFSQVVQQSISLEQTTQAWCNKCSKYQPHLQRKVLKGLPEVLALNCHIETARDLEFWKIQQEICKKNLSLAGCVAPPPSPGIRVTKMCRYGAGCTRSDCKFQHGNEEKAEEAFGEPSWVPLAMKVQLLPNGTVQVHNMLEETVPDVWQEEDAVYYDVLASVTHIKDAKTGGNLVSHVRVGETYHRRKENVTCTQSYLLNDFSITPIEKYETVQFNMEWNVPCVLYFVRRDLKHRHDYTVHCPIASDVLYANASLVTPRRRNITFVPLDDEELPKEGDVVGLDAEFVTLNQEEAELRSDGTRSTIKPSQMSCARITCIRGKGILEGEPFIDDYISTQEQVVDYLTQFSGIKPGDLDATISSKHLTTLKSTYLKLRYLVDVGVTFVGHGLKKDFRVINIIVPKNQVVDTVDLFHLPRQRMISLKFLAWFFLGINIQSVTHDSIEDARTALKLYNKYQDLCQQGMDKVKQVLKDMYTKGREMQWKIPDENDPDGSGSSMIPPEQM